MKKSILLLSALAALSLAGCGQAAPAASSQAASSAAESSSAVVTSEETSVVESSEETSVVESSEETSVVDSSVDAQITVTFKITVNNVTTQKIYVAGDFTDPTWADGKIELTAGENNVYTWTHTAELGTTINYKYVCDADWDILNPELGAGENRWHVFETDGAEVDDGTYTLPTISEDTVTVTFNITVANVGSRKLYVAGTFTSWADNKIELTAGENNVYYFTYTGHIGTKITYKYIVDTDGALDWDILNGENRVHTFAADVTEVDEGSYELSVISDETVTVTFALTAGYPGEESAYFMCSELSGWKASMDFILTVDADDDTLWTIQLTKNIGTTLAFKFVLANADATGDATWESFPGNRNFTFQEGVTTYACEWDVNA